MSEGMSASAAMEGGGAYNKHAILQAGGSAFALPHWENAIRKSMLDDGDEPIVVADYGSSQGKNSLVPMRIAIETLKSRLGPERPILIYHVDLPVNDFNALFALLDADPNRYCLEEPNVYSCAIGRSFYRRVLPPNYVHLGWSAYSALWISRIPAQPPEHIWIPSCSGPGRDAFDRQAEEDWKAFLSLRASELRPGGRLTVVLPGGDDYGRCGIEDMMDHANTVLSEMVEDGAIAAHERAQFVVSAWTRSRRELLKPFAMNEPFHGLIVEHCDNSAVADPAWAAYQRDGNKEILVQKHAAFFRATFAPSLASAVERLQDAEECHAFSERLEDGLRRRLMREPAPVDLTVETIVFAKVGSTN